MSTWTGVGQARVDVSSRNGRTRLKVKSNAIFQALMTLHPAFMIAVITIGSMSDRGLGLLGTAIAAGVSLVGLAAFGMLTKAGHRRGEQLADKLQARIIETITHSKPSHLSQSAEEELIEQRLSQG